MISGHLERLTAMLAMLCFSQIVYQAGAAETRREDRLWFALTNRTSGQRRAIQELCYLHRYDSLLPRLICQHIEVDDEFFAVRALAARYSEAPLPLWSVATNTTLTQDSTRRAWLAFGVVAKRKGELLSAFDRRTLRAEAAAVFGSADVIFLSYLLPESHDTSTLAKVQLAQRTSQGKSTRSIVAIMGNAPWITIGAVTNLASVCDLRDEEGTISAILTLGKLGEGSNAATNLLLNLFKNAGNSETTKALKPLIGLACCTIVKPWRKQLIGEVADMLGDNDVERGQLGVVQLGIDVLMEEDLAESIYGLLQNQQPSVVVGACRLVGFIGIPGGAAKNRLFDIIRRGMNQDVKVAAAAALGRVALPSDVETMRMLQQEADTALVRVSIRESIKRVEMVE